MSVQPLDQLWRCYCGLDWYAPEHQRRLNLTGGRWRGEPYSLDCWDQWCRENLPRGDEGVTYCLDDGILRSFDPKRPKDKGLWCKLELKARRAQVRRADQRTLEAVAQGSPLSHLLVTIDGDVPTPLRHWPISCSCCGAPGQRPEPSTEVVVTIYGVGRRPTINIKRLAPGALNGFLLTHLGHQL